MDDVLRLKRQVRLEDQDGGGPAQLRVPARGFDVAHQELVRLPHVCHAERPLAQAAAAAAPRRSGRAGSGWAGAATFGAECIAPKHLRTAAEAQRRTRECESMADDTATAPGPAPAPLPLRTLLLGPPLSARADADAAADAEEALSVDLDRHLRGVEALLPLTHGADDPAVQQAMFALREAIAMPPSRTRVVCKRALLLFAHARLPEVREHWKVTGTAEEAALADDLADRVLPLLTPRFFKSSCQAPGAYALAAAVLTELWPGERLGNWPLPAEPDEPGEAGTEEPEQGGGGAP